MRLSRLGLRGFRNLRDARIDLPARGVAIVGANAQGKTNLLEAIYYLEILRSFRGARDAELVRFGEEVFRVEGAVEAAGNDRPFDGRVERTLAAAWQRAGSRKKVTVDGEEPPRLADAIGNVGAVLFGPADLALVNEGPDQRRRFLDVVLSLNEPDYLPALQRYRQVLSQRNAALREGGGPGEAAVWDGLLVTAGATVTFLRNRWLRWGQETFAGAHHTISGGDEGQMKYEPAIPGLDEGGWSREEIVQAYQEALQAAREREVRQGTTVVGPHRDEVRIELLDGEERRDVRTYGSGGQRRSVALALRLLEAETIRARRDREPIFLLDDVFAELDEERAERLLDLLGRAAVGQVVLTAPKESDLRFGRDFLERWGIRGGEVVP